MTPIEDFPSLPLQVKLTRSPSSAGMTRSGMRAAFNCCHVDSARSFLFSFSCSFPSAFATFFLAALRACFFEGEAFGLALRLAFGLVFGFGEALALALLLGFAPSFTPEASAGADLTRERLGGGSRSFAASGCSGSGCFLGLPGRRFGSNALAALISSFFSFRTPFELHQPFSLCKQTTLLWLFTSTRTVQVKSFKHTHTPLPIVDGAWLAVRRDLLDPVLQLHLLPTMCDKTWNQGFTRRIKVSSSDGEAGAAGSP